MKLFNKNFIMVLIGQIISLFGNTILRFALPLYLLNETGSASLFGIISACSLIPMIFATPMGGVIADRVNKRNIMVTLDFSTAFIILIITCLLGKINLVVLLLTALILLYGIQGAYQPAVQASIPVLVPQDGIMRANGLINLVSSLSNLIGPIIGGMLFGFWGIKPILYVSVVCFFIAAVMEIFINIPFSKKRIEGSALNIILEDMKESFEFMIHERPEILKVAFIITAINFIMSACAMIGFPIIVTQKLGFELSMANRLYGYVEAAMGAGSLIGGLLSSILNKKVKIKYTSILIIGCAMTFLPIAIGLSSSLPAIVTYVIITASSLVMMVIATFFSIQLMSCLQILTPNELLGKVISCVMCISMCAIPIGQAFYGAVFEKLAQTPHIVFIAALLITTTIGITTTKMFKQLNMIIETNS